MSVAELVTHYTERELAENSGKAAKPRKAYLYIFKNYVLPKWETLPLRAVKAVAVEDWLKTLPWQMARKPRYARYLARHSAMPYAMSSTLPIPSQVFGKQENGLKSLKFLYLPKLLPFCTSWVTSSLYEPHSWSLQ